MASYGPPERLVGTVLDGTYRLERVVGEGAFGAVFAATHLRLKRPVAVKLLRVSDADAFARFRREAEVSSSLGSRHIAQVFDFNVPADGDPYLVMELLEGEDLAARLARVKRLPLDEVLAVSAQLASALAVTHRHQIVHRDLKPQNVFLARTPEGEVCKVIDFGISKMLNAPVTTGAGQLLGSPMYMSPEQVRGRTHEIDARSDVYAMGALVHEMLTGTSPFQASSVFELVEKIAGAAMPTPASRAAPDVPTAVDAVLARAMAKRREDRYAGVQELHDALAAAAGIARPVAAPPPPADLGGTIAPDSTQVDGALTPLWRGRGPGHPDQLRFAAPEGGFYPEDYRSRTLTLDGARPAYLIGSVPAFENVSNDCVLPHRQVSRNAARVTVRDGRAWLRREPRCNVPVRVGLTALERDDERPMYHGQPLTIGVVHGSFLDGRFVPPQVPAQVVDEQTGLLGREGLLWELGLAARAGDGRRLLLAQAVPATGASPATVAPGGVEEVAAVRAALALHAAAPTWPVARFGRHAAAIVPPGIDDATVARAVEGVRAAARVALAVGSLPVGGAEAGIATRLDEARAALASLASAGVGGGVADLAGLALRVMDPPSFEREAAAVVARGGEIGLAALADVAQLRELGDGVVAALALELAQLAAQHAGAGAVLTRPAPGAVAWAGPDAAEPVGRRLAAAWHARGPVRGEVVELDRGLALATVATSDLRELPRLAAELLDGDGLTAGVDDLPSPLACRLRAALAATATAARAAALVDVVDATWRVLGAALPAMALGPRGGGAPFDLASVTGAAPGAAEPWRAAATAAAGALAGATGRVGELVAALFPQGAPCPALAGAAEAARAARAAGAGVTPRDVERLEGAVGALARALRPLRGWTLLGVERVDRDDVFGDCETVSFVDHTGPYAAGAPRQVTLVKDLRMGPFVYLARLPEGLVVPLEPHVRQRPGAGGAPALWWADAPITAPGEHRFVDALGGDEELREEVSARHVPRARR